MAQKSRDLKDPAEGQIKLSKAEYNEVANFAKAADVDCDGIISKDEYTKGKSFLKSENASKKVPEK